MSEKEDTYMYSPAQKEKKSRLLTAIMHEKRSQDQ